MTVSLANGSGALAPWPGKARTIVPLPAQGSDMRIQQELRSSLRKAAQRCWMYRCPALGTHWIQVCVGRSSTESGST